MAIDNRLQVFNKEGQSVDYDILASDVKFNDGKDLPTKLAEMEAQIGEAGSGDGTVTGVKVGSNTYEPTEGVVDLSTPFSGKVDKNGTDSLMSAEEHTKLAGIEADAEKNIIKGIKANGASTNLPVDQNGVVELPPAGSTISPATAAPSMDGTANVGSSAKYAREDHRHPHDTTKQDTLTFDDAPGNTDNPVKSRGIKQAIDFVTPTIDANGKWVIGGVSTDKDAQGPMGNTVLVNENAVGIQGLIVNNVVDGGETDILSAEMGKVLRQNIMKIFNALGTYAFPEGKPTLNWGSAVINHSINVNGVTGGLTIDDVEVDGVSAASLPNQIIEGKSLSLRLVLPSDMYVFNDGVSITMGGVNITTQQGVWDESTGEINIAAVNDDIVIVASAITYVGYGEENSPLVLMFDGKHQGSTANQWENLANANKPLVLSGSYTKNTDNVQFGGTDGRGIIQSFGTDLPYDTATLEAVLSFAVLPSSDTYLLGSGNDHNSLLFVGGESGNTNRRMLSSQTKGEHSSASSNLVGGRVDNAANSFLFSVNQIISLSRQGMRYTLNNDQLDEVSGNVVIVGDSQSTFNAAGYIFVSGCTTRTGAYYGQFQGKMYCIRAYTRALTELEVEQNYKVDQKRFNIA